MANITALSPVQTLIYGILHGDATLTGLLGAGGVFDHVPPQAPFPFVAIAELRETPDDTMGTKGRMIRLTIDCYSQAEGYKELEGIAERVILDLDNDDLGNPSGGWLTASSIYIQGTLDREIDGLTRHAELLFDITVSQ